MVIGPVDDLRVIELGQLLAGPFCGQLLADFGAEVIKVEEPAVGDPMRVWGGEKTGGTSPWWPIVARGKKSITLDLRSQRGQGLVRRLVEGADVLVENFRPGTLERWNLGWEQLSAINPRLVLVRVTGWGQDGPYASRPGYGSVGEAIGGLRYVTGDPSAPPSRIGISIGDALAGMFAALGTTVALRARERTGRGQVVDTAIYEAVLALMESLIVEYEVSGHIRERSGPILPNVAPSNVYPTADGQLLLIAANQDTVFRRFTAMMGQPELADDQRFSDHLARGEYQEELDRRVTEWTSGHAVDELSKLLEEAGVPFGGIYRAPEMLADPHFAARRALVEVDHPEFGRISMQNVVPRLSDTPGSIRWLGPALGQHNAEVFGGLLGLPDEDLAALREQGVI